MYAKNDDEINESFRIMGIVSGVSFILMIILLIVGL